MTDNTTTETPAPTIRLSRYTFTLRPFGVVARKNTWKTNRFFHCTTFLGEILGVTQEQADRNELNVEELTAKFNDRKTRTAINKRMTELA